MDRPRRETQRRLPRWLPFAVGATALLGLSLSAALGYEPAAPEVDERAVVVAEAARGPLVIDVRAPGTLVPERIRWVTALTAGRVEQRLVDPGERVATDTVILVLTNPDVQLEALESDRQLTAARAAHLELRTSLEHERMRLQVAVASARAQQQDAQREVEAAGRLEAQKVISTFEASRDRERVVEMDVRLHAERSRLALLEETLDEKLALQQEQVDRLREIAAYRRERVASMTVRAGATGVLQETNLELGQWVQPGAVLGKVAEPEHLKAVLRVPETLARDIAPGQTASVDTRNGIVRGRVFRVDPAVQNGSVAVHVRLLGALPKGARPDLSIEGTVEVARLENVLALRRPAYGQPDTTISLFVVGQRGESAMRRTVQLGRASADEIEIVAGLAEGDRVIVSDMSRFNSFDRVDLD